MVARPGHDARGQDWRRALVAGPAGGARNSQTLRCSPDILAGPAVRQFWPVRAAQLDVCGHPDAVRTSGGRRFAMFLELEQGFGSVIRISPEPMREAVKTLQAQHFPAAFEP